MAGLEPYNSEDDVSRNQVFRRRVLLLLGPLVTPFIARWWWIEFGARYSVGLYMLKIIKPPDTFFNFKDQSQKSYDENIYFISIL